MSGLTVEDGYEAGKDSAVEGNKVETPDAALGTGTGGAFAMNFNLDHKMSSEHKTIMCDNDGCKDFEEVQAKKVKFKTARENLRKINSMVKSKVDVLGRVPMFRGKKRSEKQDIEAKRLSISKESKQEVMSKLHSSTSQPLSKLTSEDGATIQISTDVSCAEGNSVEGGHDALITFDDAVNSNPSGGSGVVRTSAHQIWAESSYKENKANDLLSEFSTLIPTQFEIINLQTETTPAEHPEGCHDSAVHHHSKPRPSSLHAQNVTTHPNYSAGSQDFHYSAEDILSILEPSPPKWADTIKSTTSSVVASVNRGCLQGAGPAVPVDFVNLIPNLAKDDGGNISDYHRFYFHSLEKAASERHTDQPETRASEGHTDQPETRASEDEYFDDPYCSDGESFTEDEDFWGSEFDNSSYQDDVLSEAGQFDIGETPDKPLPPKPEKKAFFSRVKSISNDATLTDEQSSTCLPVNISSQKHPAPIMPPQPPGLTQNQIKRRMIVDSIVSSERSYLESLERLVTDYEKTILEFISQAKSYVRLVFLKMREIIFHHKMFQIELAECVKVWDQEERIGDIFTGSFSKTMLISSYSIYVNSFAAAMDEIRSLQRRRQTFQDFLLKQEKLSCDRLSIFGLMVKPVQRFPQFIMFLQDLIKFTPHNHEDRMALQLALTELENVAYRLNERKRQSEQKFQARQIVQQLIKQKVQHVIDLRNLDMDPTRRLIRSDSIEQVSQNGECENVRCKDRRLILLNDHVLCVKVIQKEQSGYTVERYALRWIAKLKDLELKDTSLSDMKSGFDPDPGNISISQLPEGAQDDPFHLLADLHEMEHDSNILQKMTGLVSQLKRSYAGHGLRDGLIQEIWSDLQHMVQIKEEQLRLVNNCSIILQDNSRSDKPHYVLQTQRAATKQDWCIDFLIAKLALDKSNSLGWDGTSGSDGSDFDVIPAYFIKHIPVDVPKKYTRIKCAVSIYLSAKKSVRGLGLQHLWVCSSTPVCGQVSILAIHNSRPALIESFRACGSDIMAVELVPGCGQVTKPSDFTFSEDTVWMAGSKSEIFIFPLSSEDGVHRQPLSSILTWYLTVSMKFIEEKLFCGSTAGIVTVYSRQQDGNWDISHPTTLSFGSTSVKLHFVHEEHIWLSCGNMLCQLETTSLQTRVTTVLNANPEAHIDQVVKSGVGIWVSFHDDSVIKLFHLETLENLQEISVGNFVSRIRTEKSWAMSSTSENLAVTCLAVSRGLLWIGTSLGVVLTVPLPRLSGGVPLYRGSPKLSLHAHKGPVRFILLLQCSLSAQEMNKSNSLLETNEAKQSLHNLDRQENQKEMHERKEGTVSDVTKQLGDGDMLSKSEEHIEKLSTSPVTVNSKMSSKSEEHIEKLSSSSVPIRSNVLSKSEEHIEKLSTSPVTVNSKMSSKSEKHIEKLSTSSVPVNSNVLSKSEKHIEKLSSSSVTVNSNVSEQKTAHLKGGRSEINIPTFGKQIFSDKVEGWTGLDGSPVELRNKCRSSVIDRRSKTLNFAADSSRDSFMKSRNYSRSFIDLASVELCEVEVLYKALLEDDPDITEYRDAGSSELPGGKGSKWSSGNSVLAKLSRLSFYEATPPRLHVSPADLVPQDNSGESQPKSIQTVLTSPARSSSLSPSCMSSSVLSPQGTTGVRTVTSNGESKTTGLKPARKASSNAVVVVSGGDGYSDLDMSRREVKMDDACVLLWIHKFY